MIKNMNVILEIGCNHMGKMSVAKDLIKSAKECGADVAKFQKRNNRELLPSAQYEAPHPVPENSYGPTYGAHREFLEFSQDQHRELQDYCNELGIEYSTSVWDISSAKDIAELKPKLIKIPSASNQHYEMLGYLADNYGARARLRRATSMCIYRPALQYSTGV
jgi:sialic acid synthase